MITRAEVSAEIVFEHLVRTTNVGDLSSGPYRWFPFPDYEVIHIGDPPPPSRMVIYGGGAITSYAAAQGRACKQVIWATGSSIHGCKNAPRVPTNVDLVGIREYIDPARWVPCPSCMSHEFDLAADPTHDAVLYLNADHSITRRYPMNVGPLPTMDNRRSFREVIAFLASGQLVITNSYHGVYWATLLRRRVICVPYSTKFHFFKHIPMMSADGSDWRSLSPAVHPEALEDCRQANRHFYEEVCRLL